MQTKKQSLIETLSNVATGFITTLVLSPPIYWIAGLEVKYSQIWSITLMFTAASVLRGYIIRRWFNKDELIVQTNPQEIPYYTSSVTSTSDVAASFGISIDDTTISGVDLELLNLMKERDRTPKYFELQRANILKLIEELKYNYLNPTDEERKLLEKWDLILHKYDTNTPNIFIVKYAEHHSILESLGNLTSNVESSLQTAMHVLMSVNFKGLIPLVATEPVIRLLDNRIIEVSTHAVRSSLLTNGLDFPVKYCDVDNVFMDLLISETQKIIDQAVDDGHQLFYAYHMFCLMSDQNIIGKNNKTAFSRFTTAKV